MDRKGEASEHTIALTQSAPDESRRILVTQFYEAWDEVKKSPSLEEPISAAAKLFTRRLRVPEHFFIECEKLAKHQGQLPYAETYICCRETMHSGDVGGTLRHGVEYYCRINRWETVLDKTV